MPKYPWGKKSLEQRATLHPDLQKVVDETAEEINCTILCGHRNKKDQNAAFDKGTSKVRWPNSRHNTFPSQAVDLVPYPLDWYNIKAFKELAIIVKEAAKKVGVEIEWGGDWVKFKDYPHFQLKKK